MPADPYPYELATPEQRALGTLWIALHHAVVCERLTEPVEQRVAYIRTNKPPHEIETRLRALRPASPAMVAAWAEYDRVCTLAWAEYDRVCAPARAESERVRTAAWAALRAVLAVECPDIPWGPDGLVFPVAEAVTRG